MTCPRLLRENRFGAHTGVVKKKGGGRELLCLEGVEGSAPAWAALAPYKEVSGLSPEKKRRPVLARELDKTSSLNKPKHKLAVNGERLPSMWEFKREMRARVTRAVRGRGRICDKRHRARTERE